MFSDWLMVTVMLYGSGSSFVLQNTSSDWSHALRKLQTSLSRQHFLKSIILPEGFFKVLVEVIRVMSEIVFAYCSAIIEECCFYQLTSTFNHCSLRGASSSWSNRDYVKNRSCFSAQQQSSFLEYLCTCNNITYIPPPCFIAINSYYALQTYCSHILVQRICCN